MNHRRLRRLREKRPVRGKSRSRLDNRGTRRFGSCDVGQSKQRRWMHGGGSRGIYLSPRCSAMWHLHFDEARRLQEHVHNLVGREAAHACSIADLFHLGVNILAQFSSLDEILPAMVASVVGSSPRRISHGGGIEASDEFLRWGDDESPIRLSLGAVRLNANVRQFVAPAV